MSLYGWITPLVIIMGALMACAFYIGVCIRAKRYKDILADGIAITLTAGGTFFIALRMMLKAIENASCAVEWNLEYFYIVIASMIIMVQSLRGFINRTFPDFLK